MRAGLIVVVLGLGLVISILSGSGASARPISSGADGKAYSVNARQAREVATVWNLLAAYNRRNLKGVKGYLDKAIVWLDCDFEAKREVEFTGMRSVSRWLQNRFSDGDQIVIGRLYNENPEQPVGVIGAQFASRKSGALRRIGFPNGLRDGLGAKIVFAANGRVGWWTSGGPEELCRES